MLDVSITASFKSAKVDVSLAFDTELDYPLMKIEKIY